MAPRGICLFLAAIMMLINIIGKKHSQGRTKTSKYLKIFKKNIRVKSTFMGKICRQKRSDLVLGHVYKLPRAVTLVSLLLRPAIGNGRSKKCSQFTR